MSSTNTLKKAITAHAQGEISEAYSLYSAAHIEGYVGVPLYQNFGALCRKRGEVEKAEMIFSEGLEKYPGDPGILANRVNLWKETKPHAAIADLLYSLRRDPGLVESWANLLYLLHEQGCFSWALELVKLAIKLHPEDPRFPYRALTLILALSGSRPELLDVYEDKLLTRIDSMLESLPNAKRQEIMIALACYGQTRNNENLAKFYYGKLQGVFRSTIPTSEEESREQTKNYHITSWNYSSYLIKSQRFEEGWKLYEHGLQAPCEGNKAQKWQRELVKPFSAMQLPLWRGESVRKKKLLILSEQGIGDTVMFASLLPTLVDEGAHLTLLTSARMCLTYKERCQFPLKLITTDDIHAGHIDSEMFDWQTPVGSICQYRFDHPSKFAPLTPVLKAKEGSREYFREKYGLTEAQKLVGLSWRGGASESRKREKSVGTEELYNLLSGKEDCKFISLQYGDSDEMQTQLAERNVNLIVDHDIDAINGFPSWVDQVAACDGVISVANTTIHASGSLAVPTMCLLPALNDWRWLSSEDVQVSYWYKSVGIARQSKDGGWEAATQKVRGWIENGLPMPVGRRFMD